MSVCNLFKELTKPTGTFITFSQYLDDLSQTVGSQPSINVTPSKFYALNVDYSAFTNTTIMQKFQNEFENLIAVSKKEDNWSDIISTGYWSSKYDYFKQVFWNLLYDMGWLDYLIYENTIELTGSREHEKTGTSFSEMFCYIPNAGKKMSFQVNVTSVSSGNEMAAGNYPEGWSSENWPSTAVSYVKPSGGSYLTPGNIISIEEGQDQSDAFFNFNTVVVLYNVNTYDPETGQFNNIYTDIPLGIYFTGMIESGSMTNSVKKFVTDDSIFENGTSYGLRICSRFVSSLTDGDIISSEIVVDANEYLDYSSVMSAMAKTIQKVNDLISSINQTNTQWKDLMISLKSQKVNVPYVKEVDREPWWFVNGSKVIKVYPEYSGGGGIDIPRAVEK